MRPFYTRISSIQSLKLSNAIPLTTKPESVASRASWMEMMQQNNKVETVVQALPDQRTFNDALHAVNWTSVRYWSTVIALLLLALGAALAPPTVVSGSLRDSDPFGDPAGIYIISYFTCHPDGSLQFPWAETDYNAWAITSILDINMGFGPMPFAVVKFIDVVWDLVVGRGGQALLSILVYRVLSQALLFSMETRRSSFRKFAATSFETGSTSALRVYVQDLFMDRRARGIHSTMLVLAFVITTAYLIAFPTIISGISGYQAISTPKCNDPSGDGKMIDTSTASLSLVAFNITDGSRVGLSNNYLWTMDMGNSLLPLYYRNNYCNVSQELSAEPVCPQNRTSTWGYHYGDYYSKGAKNLTAPTLDVQPVNTTLFLYGDEFKNQTISQTYLENNTKCYPGSSYRWGFSSLELFLWLVFTSLFVTSLYAIWAPTYMFSRLDRSGRSLGLYRAVIDMTSALREEFGDDCDTMSDAQFRKQLKTRDTGIKVDPEDLPEPRYNDMKFRKWKAFNKIGRYQALRRERAASRAFAET